MGDLWGCITRATEQVKADNDIFFKTGNCVDILTCFWEGIEATISFKFCFLFLVKKLKNLKIN